MGKCIDDNDGFMLCATQIVIALWAHNLDWNWMNIQYMNGYKTHKETL